MGWEKGVACVVPRITSRLPIMADTRRINGANSRAVWAEDWRKGGRIFDIYVSILGFAEGPDSSQGNCQPPIALVGGEC